MPDQDAPRPERRTREALARAAVAERALATAALVRGDWDAAASHEESAALSEHIAALLEEDPEDGRG